MKLIGIVAVDRNWAIISKIITKLLFIKVALMLFFIVLYNIKRRLQE